MSQPSTLALGALQSVLAALLGALLRGPPAAEQVCCDSCPLVETLEVSIRVETRILLVGGPLIGLVCFFGCWCGCTRQPALSEEFAVEQYVAGARTAGGRPAIGRR